MAGKAVKGKSGLAKKKKSGKAPARKRTTAAKAKSKLRSAVSKVKTAVKKTAKKVKTAAKKVTTAAKKKLAPKAAKAAPKAAAKPAPRIVRRQTDIPLDRIAQTYTPQQTSIKAGFRSTGADHQNDQEFAKGVADDERWNDEDIYTNKTGDPRIGTHNRAYEPAEKKTRKN